MAVQKHDWLSLISVSGLLISEPVLETEFPSGLDSIKEWKYSRFKKERDRFQINLKKNPKSSLRTWLDYVFEDLLEIESVFWKKGNDIPQKLIVDLAEYNQTLKPNSVLVNEKNESIFLVLIYPTTHPLDKQESQTGRWKASPFVKLERLLRETDIPLGIVTNGEDFRLVYASAGLSTSYITWTGQGWMDEKIILESFFSFFNKARIFGKGKRKLIDLIEESQERQVDVANQLGKQVRNALDIFIKAMDKADKATKGKLLEGITLDELYHITLVVMMRFVFILYAEENFLFPHGQMIYDRGYGVTHLLFKLQQDARKSDRALSDNYNAWSRSLATFRLIHNGCSHPDLLIIGYGGDLFDPKKFPILEKSEFKISNQDIYNILRQLTFAQGKIGKTYVAQRVSYRSLDIEQIGSIYENLIDYTVKRADEELVVTKSKEESIIPSSNLELNDNKLIEFLSELLDKKRDILKKKLEDDDGNISKEKLDGLIQERIEPGQLYLTQKKGERKGSGSFYTPKDVTAFLVRKILENLVYEKKDKKLVIKKPQEILTLKICDPAMGSGAFLVQSCRYLAERLVESWDIQVSQHPDEILTLPYAEKTSNGLGEQPIPIDREEALVWAKKFVAERCMYGVDINPLSVELAKMSLWLTTMAKNKPFSFLDHHLKVGNSLIGCNSLFLENYPEKVWERSPLYDKQKKILTSLSRTVEKQLRMKKKGQSFLSHSIEMVKELQKESIESLEELEKISILDSETKKNLYHDYSNNPKLKSIKRMFNGWTALWFWPLNKENQKDVPLVHSYYSFLSSLSNGDTTNGTQKYWLKTVKKLAEEKEFFHWELEFPRVFLRENPGFDAIIGNPPWDKVKFEEPVFFDSFYLNYHRLNLQERKKIKFQLLKSKTINERFSEEREFANCFSNMIDSKMYFKNQAAKVYGLVRGGDKNLYKLFLEQIFNLTRKEGFFGLIAPATLTTDESNTGLRRLLLEKTTPLGIWTFFRRAYVFPIEQFIGIFAFQKEISSKSFVCIDNLGYESPKNIPAIMLELQRRTNESPKINSQLIKKFSEELMIFQPINNSDQLKILETMFKFPIFRKHIENNWNVSTTTELHMTNDRIWFRQQDTNIPLWRGENIHRYKIAQIPDTWVDPNCPKLKEEDDSFSRLCWVLIRDSTNVRRLSLTIIPPGGAIANSLCYIKPVEDPTLILYLCGIFNSLVCEYRVRQTAQGANLAQYIIRELPVPRLSSKHVIREEIVKRVLKLVGNTFGENEILTKKFDAIHLEKDEDERYQIEAEIEGLVAQAYGYDKETYQSLVESIVLPRGSIIKNKERQKRQFAVEMYDEMKKIIKPHTIQKQ